MGWLKALLGLLGSIFDLFRDRQLIEAGRAEQAQADQAKVEANVAAAEAAVATPDPQRDERLRNRFDRARRNQQKD